MVAFGAVVGPGVLAGLSDDDPAGITPYSILGADFGYRLLCVLLLSTVALVVFQELGARMGCVTGRGRAALIRDRYGDRAAASAAAVLLVANVGTTCAEFAGIAAASELAGVSRYASVPVAAILVSTLVVRGGFRRVEHVLLLLATVFVTYFASGVLAHPHWGAAARGLVVPALPLQRHALLVATAYSVSEGLGRQARVEASIREKPVFDGTYALVVGVGALVVLLPGAPLVPILFITQAINAVLLLPPLAFIALLTRDRSLMGE